MHCRSLGEALCELVCLLREQNERLDIALHLTSIPTIILEYMDLDVPVVEHKSLLVQNSLDYLLGL